MGFSVTFNAPKMPVNMLEDVQSRIDEEALNVIPDEEETSSVDWVVMYPPGEVDRDQLTGKLPFALIRCEHCGSAYQIPTGEPLWAGLSLMQGFSSEHEGCTEQLEGVEAWAPADFTTLEAWRNGRDTGASSLTIYYALFGGPQSRAVGAAGCIPYDPGDFGRCLRLVRGSSGIRALLPEVARIFPVWEPYVAAWDELEALWTEEIGDPWKGSGSAPKLYARLQELGTTGIRTG